MATSVISSIQFKRGKKAALTAKLINANRLKQGEPAFETDTGKMKIGDGVTDYAKLPYVSDGGSSTSTKLVYSSIYDLPSVGSADSIYVILNGNTYTWDATNLHYNILYTNNKQFYAEIVDEDGNVKGAERQIDAGGATADYNIENYII